MKQWAQNWRKQLRRSGTANDVLRTDREDKIYRVLNRQAGLNSLEALSSAYRAETIVVAPESTAFVFDSSVFLRMSRYDDVVDYFGLRHSGALVLPGQSIKEFWNNHLNTSDTIATSIKKKFDALAAEIEKIDPSFIDFGSKFTNLIEEFRSDYGYVYDPATLRRTQALFEMLQSKATIGYISRDRFAALAAHRKSTKTPPGFKDPAGNDGDYFVWLDMLDGLLRTRYLGSLYTNVVLVTEDKKLDWSRETIAHPILASEVEAVCGASFQIWNLARLAREVATYTE